MADLLVTATSGLRTFQQALSVTAHNVANVNTTGYSRQTTNIVAGAPQLMGGGYVGSGALTQSITRVYQDYLTGQVNDSYTYQNKYKTADTYSTQLNATLGDPTSGIYSTMDGFYQSLNTMANDPTSSNSAQFLLQSGTALQQQVQTYRSTRADLHGQVNGQLVSTVAQINEIANQLVRVNADLGSIAARQDLPPNDLLDKRDQLVKDINQYMDVKVYQNKNGTIDVYSTDGKIPLIADNRAVPLQVTYNPMEKLDPTTGAVTQNDKQEVWLQQPGTGQNIIITSSLRGGELAGAASFRNDQLTPAEDQLGLAVVGMSIAMNAQSRQGFDKVGVRGGDVFSLNNNLTNPKPYVNAAATNTGTQALSVSGSASPSFAYKVTYNGANYDLTDAKTGAAIAGGTGIALPQVFNGVTIGIAGGAPASGDNFLIGTTAPKLMSSASSYASGTNTGTQGITTTGSPNASFAYKLTYNGTSYDVTDAYTKSPIAGSPVSAATLNSATGWSSPSGVTIKTTGALTTPKTGDSFEAYSTTDFYASLEQNAYKDNRNTGTIPNSAITVNLDRTGLSTGSSKFSANDMSSTADFAQLQTQLARLQPRSYSLSYDGANYTVTDSRTGISVPATQSATPDDPSHPNVKTLRFEGLQIDIDTSAGTVKAGDKFEVRFLNDGTIGFNQSITNPDTIAYRGADTNATPANSRPLAIGNNVNAANMASLQNKKLFLNNSDSAQGVYSLMAGNVGSYHQANMTSMSTQDALYSQLNQTQSSVSGVNLDEEAANMMKFQQAYQAAAKIMQASQTLFDTIIAIR